MNEPDHLLHPHDHEQDHDHGGPQVDHFDAATSELAGALRRSFGVLKFVMLILVVLYLLSGWFFVERGERAVVYRFGDIVGRGTPGAVKAEGWYLSWPFPIDSHVKVSTAQRTLPISFMLDVTEKEKASGKIGAKYGPLSPARDDYLVTGDENIIHASFEIRYEVDENQIVDYLQNVYDMPAPKRADEATRPDYEQRPEYTILTNLARNAAIEAAVEWEAMSVLQNRQDAFLHTVEAKLGKRLEELEAAGTPLGIRLSDSGGVIAQKQLELEAIMPPRQVKDAFDRVFTAEQRKSQQIALARSRGEARLLQVCGANYAEVARAIDDEFELILDREARDGGNAEKRRALLDQQQVVEDLLNAAAGEAGSIVLQARSQKDSIIKDAQGDYGRLMAVLPEYLKNPNLFISRRTEDMLRTVLSYNDVMKVAVPPDAKEVRLTIPKDEQAPIGREIGKDRMKIDTDSLEIPSNVSAR
ncbi:MAG TPA: SPFH domain-containing protein [Phycisphaerae bacterium]|nr:SPFH domain-containing protein [Phycisphaerae bacterium]HRW53491.1 SPFH domain-containing protein [Phycisphaerae bacterium]